MIEAHSMPKIYSMYVDGACRKGNPGVCSCAWVLYKDGLECARAGYFLGPELHTNNFSEYQALIFALEYLHTSNIRNVMIYSDSWIVVAQVNQACATYEKLKPLMTKAYGLLTQGCHVLKQVKGHAGVEGNEEADRLCNSVLDAQETDAK
jgi:ribonuclease HI